MSRSFTTIAYHIGPDDGFHVTHHYNEGVGCDALWLDNRDAGVSLSLVFFGRDEMQAVVDALQARLADYDARTASTATVEATA